MSSVMKSAASASASSRDDRRWAAVVSRDARADGRFFFCVKTTGVYCRPSCPARTPKRDNVEFHVTREAAAKAGFRPCKRCKPDQPPLAQRRAETIAAACRRIEQADELPSLDDLARDAGMSRYHFHRTFRAITGVTPRAYAAARRAARVRENLVRADSVTAAIYDAGFNSSGRFYDSAHGLIGMTPTALRAGGESIDIRFAIGECSLGSILVAASPQGICAITLGDDPEALARGLQDRFPRANLIGGDAEFERCVATIVGFVEAPGVGLDLPLDVRGTAFQQRVWQALTLIPPGSTATYAEVAASIGAPGSQRAVARACAANPIAVAIPCHRVVRSDGALSGYRWGVERKRALLAREARR
jgi:AraC family transcriptional regulator of adaptative response/methylated-DNA-[protein]-cysteine methyltransferase